MLLPSMCRCCTVTNNTLFVGFVVCLFVVATSAGVVAAAAAVCCYYYNYYHSKHVLDNFHLKCLSTQSKILCADYLMRGPIQPNQLCISV